MGCNFESVEVENFKVVKEISKNKTDICRSYLLRSSSNVTEYVYKSVNVVALNKGEKDSGFKSCKKKLLLSIPDSDNIHEVKVVPTLDPIIIPIVWFKSIIPELTSPTNITVKADDDCIAIVIPAPNASALNGFEVKDFNIFSSLPPDNFSNPDDITFIPYKKNASPPNNVKMENIFIKNLLY